MFDPYAAIQLRVEQVQQALGDENKYFASQKLGREPTLRELLTHYIDNTTPYRVTAFNIGMFVCPECGQYGNCHHHH